MSENLDGKPILVTGGAGWLGQGLLHALVKGHPDRDNLGLPVSDAPIRAMVLPGQEAVVGDIAASIEPIVGDLRRRDDCDALCKGAEGGTLFHLAGIIHPRRVREFFEINVEGSKNILAAAADAGVRRAVIMSSNSPIGCNPHRDHLFDEQSPYHPYMAYGRSKKLLEQHVHQVQEKGDLQTVLIRSPWFYGPFQPPRQTLFFEMIRDGKGPIVGDGENRRSMAYIDNIVQGLVLAATAPEASGQTYWIADARPYTMNEIVDTVERLLETEFNQACRHKRMRLPSVASEIAWVCDWLIQKLGLYHQKMHVLSEMNKTIACDISKARKDLGYEPTVALEEGMRRSIDMVKGNWESTG